MVLRWEVNLLDDLLQCKYLVSRVSMYMRSPVVSLITYI